jgi:hypothetical protein
MASSTPANTFELGERRNSGGSARFKSLRSLPKSWIIAAVIFYCASVITVGLLAGLLPRRTQHITILATPTQITGTSTGVTTSIPGTSTSITTTTETITTTQDPSKCIDDECNPRLSSDIIVDSYELEYIYNDTQQSIVQGQVTIEFTLKQPVKQLIYHSKRMITLEEPALFEDNVYLIVSMRKYLPNDYISLRLSTNTLFAPNRYRLIQKFSVSLTDGNVGFYESVFKDVNGTMG